MAGGPVGWLQGGGKWTEHPEQCHLVSSHCTQRCAMLVIAMRLQTFTISSHLAGQSQVLLGGIQRRSSRAATLLPP